MSWVDVIKFEELEPEIGVPALVDGHSVAVFRTVEDEVFALSNHDPKTKAPVIARGIVGTIGDVQVVASPLYKDHFDLRTGRCLENEELSIASYPARVVDGLVQVSTP